MHDLHASMIMSEYIGRGGMGKADIFSGNCCVKIDLCFRGSTPQSRKALQKANGFSCRTLVVFLALAQLIRKFERVAR